MKTFFVLLLFAAGAVAVRAGAARNLLQSTARCPIDHCNNHACAYNSRRRSWTCSSCQSPLVPNQRNNACVCPAGQYPTVGTSRCTLCRKGYYCPRGSLADQSTAKPCPKNMDTLSRGAKSITDCVNKPGFFYQRTAVGVKAEPCPVDTYSPGLAKQTQCTRCLSGFNTDPELVPGSQTSSRVCVAKPGYFVAGDSTAPCPQGEFNDAYDKATSCTPCFTLFDKEYAVGITTAGSGTASSSGCRVAEPGYVLVTEKKMAILSAPAPDSGYKLGGAKPCPQKYFCPGGDVEKDITAARSEANTTLAPGEVGMLAPQGQVKLWTTGIPIRCPGGTWTEEEGAKTVDECVARPGSYIAAGNETTPIMAVKCPTGTYKEEWDRALGCKSCEDPAVITTSPPASPWLSDETIYINDMDPTTGLVNRQLPTRGSSDSCFIQKGMGTLIVRNGTGKVTLLAQVCPANSYGIDDAKKFGRIATPCAPCPANMATAGKNGTAAVQITSYLGNDGLNHNIDTDQGYFGIGACMSKPGYGYYNGNAQKCPKGTYNPGGNQMPCTTCPVGLTTDAAAVNIALDNCTFYMAGYGTVEGIVQQCPLGSFQPQDTPVGNGTACQTCSGNRWSATTGAVGQNDTMDGTSCSLCAAGFGDNNWDPSYVPTDGSGPTCDQCKDGQYGDLTRTNPRCQVCPVDRTFSYAYTGTQDVVKPQATSPLKANSIEQCVTDFQQVVDGAFYIKFAADSMVSSAQRMENIQSCVEECRNSLGCAAITFNYDPDNKGEPCQLFMPAGAEGDMTAAFGFAWKTMPSSVQAQGGKDSVEGKAVGSGLYSYYWGVAESVFDAGAVNTATGVFKLTDCLNGCSNKNLCAGFAYTGYDPLTDIIATCSHIMGTAEPGSSLRSLTRTIHNRLQAAALEAACADGLYADLTGSVPTCQACPSSRTFTYVYNGNTDVVTPPTTSPTDASSVNQCVTEMQQVVDGAFYIKFAPESMTAPSQIVSNIDACIKECRNTATCAAITYSYLGGATQPCQMFTPASNDPSTTAAEGVAWKTVSSTTQAQSVRVQSTGSELFSFLFGVPDTAFEPEAQVPVSAANLVDCMAGCSADSLCAGVAYAGYDADTGVISSCKNIMGTIEAGTHLRSLTRAKHDRLLDEPPKRHPDSTPGYTRPKRPDPQSPAPVAPVSPSPSPALEVPPGHELIDGQVQKCPEGKFNPGGQQLTCQMCPVGMTTDAALINTAAVSCALYKPGYGTDGKMTDKCPKGTFNPGGQQSTCSRCPEGLTTDYAAINDGSDSCTLYKPGYGDVDGKVQKCPEGTYSPGGEQATCQQCPEGTTTDAAADSCNLYTPGYGKVNGNIVKCPQGTFSPGGQQSTCTACPQGLTTDPVSVNAAVDSCKSYLPGYGTVDGKVVKCPEATFSPGGEESTCERCPTGLSTDVTATNTASASCAFYAAGYGSYGARVQQCPLGTYQTPGMSIVAGDGTCQSCSGNRWTPNIGAVSLGYKAGAVSCSCYGDDAWTPADAPTEGSAPSCSACQQGLYGDQARTNPKCQVCPSILTFATDANSGDVVVPLATSPPKSTNTSQCVTDFQQIRPDALSTIRCSNLSRHSTVTNASACIQACRSKAVCAGAFFDYEAGNCLLMDVAFSKGFPDDPTGATAAFAWKTLAATSSNSKPSGLYSFFWGYDLEARRQVSDVAVVPIDPAEYTPNTYLRGCLERCDASSDCAGVSLTGGVWPIFASCKHLNIDSSTRYRGLTKTRYTSLVSVKSL